MDQIEAWQYGPVIPQLYHLYKVFGGENIDNKGIDHSQDLDDDFNRDLIEKVLKIYKEYTAVELSILTHGNNSPWDKTVREKGIGAIIENNLIRDYYTKFIYDFLIKSHAQ